MIYRYLKVLFILQAIISSSEINSAGSDHPLFSDNENSYAELAFFTDIEDPNSEDADVIVSSWLKFQQAKRVFQQPQYQSPFVPRTYLALNYTRAPPRYI
ncbi:MULTISPECIES: hypothetical protein [Thalassotalea]|uniref:Secreted protein n=1 Tax=Thalassotalea castellviae TaxID=3075612 RepID=A0ABU3A0E8_9GAMM|nr:hypothetical protein [Thalassotalea sp. W431]MDT0603017.1 hypothetical protein [Thalassotalea sp. W431]